MTVKRIESHIVKPSDKYYKLLRRFCHRSKNLYNQALYLMRQQFFKDESLIAYGRLDKLVKANTNYPDYRNMPTAQSAQQTLRLLCANWKAFLAAREDYRLNPEKYLSEPRCPNYLKKDGCQVLVLTNQECKLRDGLIVFPKVFEGFMLKFIGVNKSGFKSFQQVRIVPKDGFLKIEIVYKLDIPKVRDYNGRCVALDLGVDNLAVMANNFHAPAVRINGKLLKSINQYYNKQRAAIQSELARVNNQETSKRLKKLTVRRNRKIDDYLHKTSRKIVDWCVKNQVTQVIIGHNDNWKQNSNLGKRNNQNFVSIPFSRFISMFSYKARDCGIFVTCVEESYTSGTSFIDNEPPEKDFYNKSRRVHRGLFVSNQGMVINADLNGAYQIMKKVVPMEWDRGCVLHPVTVSVA